MTAVIPARLAASLPCVDSASAARARTRIGDGVYAAWGPATDFLDAAFAAAPYLARLGARRPETLRRLVEMSPETGVEQACTAARAAGEAETEAEVLAALRAAKADLHLTVALADLAGAFDVSQVTAALSDFADAAVQGALHAAARLGGFDPVDPDNPVPGYFVLTLGKHGQRSLNFSSDIDLVIAWDPEVAQAPDGKEPNKAFARLAQKLAFLMQDLTADGYVFRVDLRLRPDPSSTPAAVSTDMARHYFEAVGQNWERAAYAKARWCAGDREAAAAFLNDLIPFIWRRTLDYAAVEDIRSLAKQIQAVGDRASIKAAGHDVKLGRGGIREIEFYAQVIQLVFGGRKPHVRVPGTLSALSALSADGLIEAGDAARLAEAYTTLRAVEHRIQMLEDEQTQVLPASRPRRQAVAVLMGEPDLAAFDARMTDVFETVHAIFSTQFEAGESLATSAGSLVLTGVEPTPDTLATLTAHGFTDPDRIWERLAGWAAGRARAARTERARRLFSRLAPRLVEGLAATGDPDAAFVRFAAFFEGLPSGVQPLSLLTNQPELAQELISVLGLAPRLAEILARRPNLLDCMLEPAFARPVRHDPPAYQSDRFAAIDPADFEDALNAARRLAREEKLRIGAQLLLSRARASEAGAAFAELADSALSAMARAASAEVARRHGPPPGRWAVLGLGKLGGRELSAQSDLDLMVVYDPAEEPAPGPKPVDAETWFIRLAQRLVSALSAPTEEGQLFDVDMALRPSGSAGPIAVRLSRFATYYASEEAWTWERMALTRGRVVFDAGLGEALEGERIAAISRATEPDQLHADAADMRARLERDKPARSPWDLKLRPGGLIDIEFIAQLGQLAIARPIAPTTAAALDGLRQSGWLAADDARGLHEALEDYQAVIQLLRAAHGDQFDPTGASAPFAERLAQAAQCPDIGALAAKLDAHASFVRALFEQYVGPVELAATE